MIDVMISLHICKIVLIHRSFYSSKYSFLSLFRFLSDFKCVFSYNFPKNVIFVVVMDYKSVLNARAYAKRFCWSRL